VFVERLWRSVKYEEVYLHAYETPKQVNAALTRYFRSASTTRITSIPVVPGTGGQTRSLSTRRACLAMGGDWFDLGEDRAPAKC
jgi:hypothetical protein